MSNAIGSLPSPPPREITGFLPVSDQGVRPDPELLLRFGAFVAPSLNPMEARALEFVGLLSANAATALGWCLIANGQWQSFRVESHSVLITEHRRIVPLEGGPGQQA